MDKIIEKIVNLSKGKVKFIILFGSAASGKQNKFSDTDLAVFYDGDKKERFNFRLKVSESEKYDIQIFQDLPLYVQKEVLKGKIVYAKDQLFVYDVAYETIKRFEDFKRGLYDYIQRRKELRHETIKKRDY